MSENTDYACDEAIADAKRHINAVIDLLKAEGQDMAVIHACEATDCLNRALGYVIRARVAKNAQNGSSGTK
jgi:hypothetical protein